MLTIDPPIEEPAEFDLNLLSYSEKVQLVKALEDKQHHEEGTRFYRWFSNPDDYPKHMSFLADGFKFSRRAFLAGNRVGKTTTGAFEATCHLTGIYPDFWKGKVFTEPTNGWIVGKNGTTVRDTSQLELLGPLDNWGTGMLPRDSIVKIGRNSTFVDFIQVQHISGGVSTIYFKSNAAGRQSFEGTSKDWIWLDEECDLEVYFECMARIMTTNGIIWTTFTPMKGLTPLILSLLKDGNLETPAEGVSVTTCTWDDVPHLSETVKAQMLKDLPPWQRAARSRGVPSIGSGAIYPIDPLEYTLKPFEIPAHWLKLCALDVGWTRTAALWLAKNPDDGVTYAYTEHYRGQAEPIVHAEAIKGRGKIPVVIDSAANGRSQVDGESLFQLYTSLGLDLHNANKAVETGIYTVWSALSFGKLKIFENCSNLLSEMKIYRRDEKGHIVKSDDHLCDCLRYGIMTFDVAKSSIPKKVEHYGYNPQTRTGL